MQSLGVTFGQTERIKLSTGRSDVTECERGGNGGRTDGRGGERLKLAMRINNSMQSGVGQFGLDQCRERINILAMFVFKDVIFCFKNHFLVIIFNYESCQVKLL